MLNSFKCTCASVCVGALILCKIIIFSNEIRETEYPSYHINKIVSIILHIMWKGCNMFLWQCPYKHIQNMANRKIVIDTFNVAKYIAIT